MNNLLKIPGLRSVYRKYVQKQEDYLRENREEVLFLYRRLRKAIPPTIDRELARQSKLAVFTNILLGINLNIRS